MLADANIPPPCLQCGPVLGQGGNRAPCLVELQVPRGRRRRYALAACAAANRSAPHPPTKLGQGKTLEPPPPHLHAQSQGQLSEFVTLRHEIRLAVQFHHHARPASVWDGRGSLQPPLAAPAMSRNAGSGPRGSDDGFCRAPHRRRAALAHLRQRHGAASRPANQPTNQTLAGSPLAMAVGPQNALRR